MVREVCDKRELVFDLESATSQLLPQAHNVSYAHATYNDVCPQLRNDRTLPLYPLPNHANIILLVPELILVVLRPVLLASLYWPILLLSRAGLPASNSAIVPPFPPKSNASAIGNDARFQAFGFCDGKSDRLFRFVNAAPTRLWEWCGDMDVIRCSVRGLVESREFSSNGASHEDLKQRGDGLPFRKKYYRV